MASVDVCVDVQYVYRPLPQEGLVEGNRCEGDAEESGLRRAEMRQLVSVVSFDSSHVYGASMGLAIGTMSMYMYTYLLASLNQRT